MATRLRNLVIDRVDLVDKGANQHAHVVLVKRDVAKDAPGLANVHVDAPINDERDGDYEKSVMTPAHRNALSDSAFAAVWTDAHGTKQRKLPYKNAAGSVDLAHLRNALSRLPQSDLPENVKATASAKLRAAAKEHGVGKQHSDNSLMKRFLAAMATLAKAEPAVPAHIAQLKAFHDHLGKMIEGCAVDGSHDHLAAEHPVHKLKGMHKDLGEMLGAYGEQTGGGGLADFEDVSDLEEPGGEYGEPGEGFDDKPKNRNGLTKREASLEKRVTLAEKRAQDAEDLAKRVQRDANLAKRKDGLRKFAAVPVNPDTDAELFERLETADPDVYKRVMTLLDGADAGLRKSSLFTEFGTERPGGGASAWSRIEALAAEVVTKDAKMTKAKAIDLVMKKNPDLVREHLAESKQ